MLSIYSTQADIYCIQVEEQLHLQDVILFLISVYDCRSLNVIHFPKGEQK